MLLPKTSEDSLLAPSDCLHALQLAGRDRLNIKISPADSEYSTKSTIASVYPRLCLNSRVAARRHSRPAIPKSEKVRHGKRTIKRVSTWLTCIVYFLIVGQAFGATKEELQQRRARAAVVFHDGILLVHARSQIGFADDSMRQDSGFYYLTGLENTVGAVFALDGESGESWLFLSADKIFRGIVEPSEVTESPESAEQLGIDHVVSARELPGFLSERAKQPKNLYYEAPKLGLPDLPASMISGQQQSDEPTWIAAILARWPLLHPEVANTQLGTLRAIQSTAELQDVRKAAKTSVVAVMAGMYVIRPGVSQRSAEVAVYEACWNAGAHGVSFFPWVMSGANSVIPRPLNSLVRYDQLDSVMKAGDLARLDIGCESNHYGGDLGRTIPVSGHFTTDQRETWNLFVDAYLATAKTFRDGVSPQQVFATWRGELLKHRGTVSTDLAKRAIDRWTDQKNVPFWEVHLMNLEAGFVDGALRTGMTIDFEPIADIDGQGYYLEDMYLIKKDGAEVLTPGVPYTAEEIEAAMQRKTGQ